MKPYVLIAGAVVAFASAAWAVSESSNSPAFEIDFSSHIDVGMAEQDVLIERHGDASVVFRVTPDDSDMNAPLFAAAAPMSHNPFDPSTNGPHPKGDSLGMTLGDWLSAKGTARYSVKDGHGRLVAEFEGLVPNGVYTMWHFFMSAEGTDPFIGTFDLPVGKTDGTQSVFVADAEGRAVFDQTIAPGLQLSGEQLAAGLAIAWHSDNETYGAHPGEFGFKTHLHLFAALPAAD